jgi:hypothetical protein
VPQPIGIFAERTGFSANVFRLVGGGERVATILPQAERHIGAQRAHPIDDERV